ncbi:undecaprenyl-diphosphate phosphatase [Solihabitans fulvus]|uniref:Undecaprenyl-diphosphatase n=1 Tax=Solihabitans fulvus TaxID=1892852 RepID=A0A5B2WPI9_9PSEU|nr:undecaprenyl-diphosphate phosphatase [Solihabitans fulvus]KAA2253873.1 undecaprenyl-diphosphate phosphatase [Solihabitans fulvus]
MTWFQALILGLVQGLTEFLPISSSGHLRIVSELFFGDDAGASFTAVTQLGTELAVLIYFAKDIGRLIAVWFKGIFSRSARATHDYRLAWYVIIGSIPIGLLGLLLKDLIRTSARNLWITASMLIVFAGVLALADHLGRQRRAVDQLIARDGLVMGLAQCLALIPGVSRSGGTISAGLFLGLTRETAARFSFLLAIPAVFASGVMSIPDVFEKGGPGLLPSAPQMIVATAIAFAVGYATIAWLLRYVSRHSYSVFVWYRLFLGIVVLGLLSMGLIPAT